MKSISITDNLANSSCLFYIKDNIEEEISMSCETNIYAYDERIELLLRFPEENFPQIRERLNELIADVYGIYYKSEFFFPRIKTEGLTEIERGILLSAFISADIEDDRKYILNRLKELEGYALDGFFNFRLVPLKRKWEEIVEYIPCRFSAEKLKDFISFIVDEKHGKRVYVAGNSVYDSRFQRKNKGNLIKCNGKDKMFFEASVLQEVLLSGCGEVEVFGKMDETEEKYLKTFFGDKIIFAKTADIDKNS